MVLLVSVSAIISIIIIKKVTLHYYPHHLSREFITLTKVLLFREHIHLSLRALLIPVNPRNNICLEELPQQLMLDFRTYLLGELVIHQNDLNSFEQRIHFLLYIRVRSYIW